ncbi:MULTISPECIES: ribose ABC transporter [Streptomyces]|uniref:ribose ABC transporter n=1 Tax=Streptomyces TaxID=1883 RepID=UPI00017E7F7D|nr:ribose ABC transporter [Streptomyces sp. Mg1]RPK44256.1 Galactose/methyl galactoside import ATP-binding protein MglA [Streptomyces sp. ADI91-18]
MAVVRALARRAEVLVMDESTATLSAADCARLFDVLHTLRDGRLVSAGPLAGYGPARLVRDIAGGLPTGRVPAAPVPSGRPAVLRLDAVTTQRAGPVSLDLAPGEILGMVGLTGAGHMQTLARDLSAAAVDAVVVPLYAVLLWTYDPQLTLVPGSSSRGSAAAARRPGPAPRRAVSPA